MTTLLALDSGAYSAFTQKTKINIGDYITFVEKHKDQFELYFNLDVLSDGGKSYTNWVHMRAFGLDPIPVFHIGTNERYLKRYLQATDYIAIGAIANMSTNERMKSLSRVWREYLTDNEGMPLVKVHGFGLTSIRIMKQFPWYSVDSTSWVMFGRYGAILIPRTRDGQYVYDENPYIVAVSSTSPRQKDAQKHFCNWSENVQNHILKYINDMGFEMGPHYRVLKGKRVLCDEDRDGLSNVHYLRDQINMFYYVGVQNSIPDWPWAWKHTETNQQEL